MTQEAQDTAYRPPAEPPDVRTFRLDPVACAADLRALALRKAAQWTLIALAADALLFWVSHGTEPLFVYVPALLMPAMYLRMSFNPRASVESSVARYELLMTPRVLRRMAANGQPAEVLRPEVARVVETDQGLWVTSAQPPRALLVGRSVDGYADVRAALGAWRPIESLSGRDAAQFARESVVLHGSRDAQAGTALETDTSLREELARVRAASADRGARVGRVGRPPANPYKQMLVWTILIVMLLALWHYAGPRSSRDARPRERAASGAI